MHRLTVDFAPACDPAVIVASEVEIMLHRHARLADALVSEVRSADQAQHGDVVRIAFVRIRRPSLVLCRKTTTIKQPKLLYEEHYGTVDTGRGKQEPCQRLSLLCINASQVTYLYNKIHADDLFVSDIRDVITSEHQ